MLLSSSSSRYCSTSYNLIISTFYQKVKNHKKSFFSATQTITRTFKSRKFVRNKNSLVSIKFNKQNNLLRFQNVAKSNKNTNDADKQFILTIAFVQGANDFVKFEKKLNYLFYFNCFVLFVFIFYDIFKSKLFLSHPIKNNKLHQLEKETKVKFIDVIGNEEAKKELGNFVHFLHEPNKFHEIGAKLPKSVLFTGPPGVGKTFLAKAVAGEAGVSFLYTSGADLNEHFLSVGSSQIRELFHLARSHAPCLVFIDKINLIGQDKSTTKSSQLLNPFANQMFDELINEIDALQSKEGVWLFAATSTTNQNEPSLDKALKIRFELKIPIRSPTVKDRKDFYKLYLKSIKHDVEGMPKTILRELAAHNYSRVRIMKIVNGAAMEASLAGRDCVGANDLWTAREKIIKTQTAGKCLSNKDENLRFAYRVAANAIVTLFTPDATPFHKISIIPTCRGFGWIDFMPVFKSNRTASDFKAAMDVAVAARIVEELRFGRESVTKFSATRSQKTIELAREMVTMYGMSIVIGPRSLEKNELLSESFKQVIEEEITCLVQESYDRVHKLLMEHAKELDLLTFALMKHETLNKEDVATVLEGGTLNKKHEN